MLGGLVPADCDAHRASAVYAMACSFYTIAGVDTSSGSFVDPGAANEGPASSGGVDHRHLDDGVLGLLQAELRMAGQGQRGEADIGLRCQERRAALRRERQVCV